MRIAVAPIVIDRYTRLDEDSTGTVLACLPEDEGPEDENAIWKIADHEVVSHP